MEQTTISNFLATDYKNFSFYVLENRAIPSIIDGFKPVQRKIIYVCNDIWKTGNEKELKVFQLSGAVANKAYYHHGSDPLEKAIINMAQHFKNSLPLLEEDGQYGSLRDPKAGAARYIGTKLSKNFRLLYKDFDLLNHKEEEGDTIEPVYYYPIIPTVLLNGSQGIAVGFASNILNRDPKDLIDACVNILNNKAIKTIKPYINGFNGEFINDNDNNKRWIIKGKFNITNTTTLRITELPPSMTNKDYEDLLDKLVDDKKIVSYSDNCNKNVDYILKFTREDLASYTEDKLIKMLKLEEYNTENFNTLDENGKIKLFESDVEIINYFVDFRIKIYHKRKEHLLEKLKHELKILMNRGKFIKSIIDGKLEVKNKSKENIIESIKNLNLDLIDDSYDYLLRMPIWSLSVELFEKLKSDFTTKKAEMSKMEKEDPKDWYLEELKELKKKI